MECDICGSYNKYGNYYATEAWAEPIAVAYCPKCALYYLVSRPEISEMKEHYEVYYRRIGLDRLVKEMVSNERRRFQCEFISKHIGEPINNSLEIGSPNGRIIRKLPASRRRVSVDSSVKNAHLTGGIECYSSLEEVECVEFDLIAASHVIEHFQFPLFDVRRVLSRLKRDGLVYIEVPLSPRHDDDSTIIRRYLNTDHIVNFTEKSLIKFVRLLPLEKVAWRLYEINLPVRIGKRRRRLAQCITEGVGNLGLKAESFLILMRSVFKHKLFVETEDSTFCFGKNIQLIARKCS